MTVAGYLSERVMAGADVEGYDLSDLRTGERLRLLRRASCPEGETVGQFAVDPAGFAAAGRIIARSRPTELFVLDELGRLELSGRGVWPAAGPILMEKGRNVLVVIREGLLDQYLALFSAAGGPAVSVVRLPASKDPEILVRAVAENRN